MSAQLASAQRAIDPESSEALSQIETSVQAIFRMVQDLLDFAATGLGATMPLAMAPMNLELLGREVLGELKSAHPNRMLRFDVRGDLTCSCDGARMRQVISDGRCVVSRIRHRLHRLSPATPSREKQWRWRGRIETRSTVCVSFSLDDWRLSWSKHLCVSTRSAPNWHELNKEF
jgi:hypothetical protein